MRGYYLRIFQRVHLICLLTLFITACGGGGGDGSSGGSHKGGNGGGSKSSVVYVTEQFSGELSRVDIDTSSVTKIASGLNGPVDVAITSDGAIAYVTEQTGGALSRVNLSTGQITRITSLTNPRGVAISPDEKTVYVLAAKLSYGLLPDSLYAIDLSTGAKTLLTDDLDSAIDIEIESGGTSALVTTYTLFVSGKLNRINLSTGSVTEIANLYSSYGVPQGLAIESDGNNVVVTIDTPGCLKKVNLTTENLTTLSVKNGAGQPYGVVIEDDGKNALVTLNSGHELLRVNLSTGQTTTIIDINSLLLMGPAGLAMKP